MNQGIRGSTNDLSDRQFYHGTRAELRPGDLVAPDNLAEVDARDGMTPYVFLASNLDEAIWEAEIGDGEGPGRVYVVEPTGELQDASELTSRKSPGHPLMSYYSGAPLRVTGEVTEWPLYHGTRADLKPGDLIEPGYSSNYGKRTAAAFVYLTRTLDAATWGAELAAGAGPGRIYRVEPTGPIEDDPNLTNKRFRGNPTKAFRSRAPLRVTGEVKDWQGHAPEVLKAMKDGLKQLEQLGVEAIED
ncbi:MAG: NAD(+)--rifampin ADP-ribosyltransferase [Litorilinea sp.]